jgi:hypothetical protein
MFGNFKQKEGFEKIIRNKVPVIEFIPETLVFKEYSVAKFETLKNDVIPSKSDKEFCFIIISSLLQENECTMMRCGSGINENLGAIRFPILFFETYIFIGMSFGNQLLYAILTPVVSQPEFASIAGMESSTKIVSLVHAIRADPKPEDVERILYKDIDLIIRKLAELKENG